MAKPKDLNPEQPLVERLAKLEALAENVRRAIWLATILGLSVGGGVGFLWARFETANSRISTLSQRVSDVEDKAADLETALDPEAIAKLARKALTDVAPDVLKEAIAAVHRDIPTRIDVSKGMALAFGNQNRHDYYCSDSNQVMIAGAFGTTNSDFSAFCGTLSLAK